MALHDLFEPEVVRDVPQPVGDQQRAHESGGHVQPARPNRAEHARQEQRRDHEQRALQAVMVAVVDRGMSEVRARLHAKFLRLKDLAEDGHTREPEAELGGCPRERDQHERRSEYDAEDVTAHDAGTKRRRGQRHECGDCDTGSRDRIAPRRIEVRLAQHTRREDREPEHDGCDRGRADPADVRRRRKRGAGQRRREHDDHD